MTRGLQLALLMTTIASVGYSTKGTVLASLRFCMVSWMPFSHVLQGAALSLSFTLSRSPLDHMTDRSPKRNKTLQAASFLLVEGDKII